jgi:hypothetical protein
MTHPTADALKALEDVISTLPYKNTALTVAQIQRILAQHPANRCARCGHVRGMHDGIPGGRPVCAWFVEVEQQLEKPLKAADAKADVPGDARGLCADLEQVFGIKLERSERDRVLGLITAFANARPPHSETGEEDDVGHLIVNTVAVWLNQDWHDEFLAFYKPEKWAGSHRAAASFIAQKVKAITSRARQQQEWLPLPSTYEETQKLPPSIDCWVVHSEHGGRREANCQNRNGTLLDSGGNCLSWTHSDGERNVTSAIATHYMPLPTPPSPTKEKA